MDVLFVSARSPGSAPDPNAATVRRIAIGLVESDAHRVRWICPWPTGADAPSAPPNVELDLVPTDAPPFRKVTSRLVDLDTEARLVARLRSDPPDLVHLQGFGGASSYLLAWTADRLGVPSVIVAEPEAAVLCHRGTLVDSDGEICDRWDDPKRCRDCATIAGPETLGRTAATMARVLRAARGLSPYPSIVDFENRLDMIVHGLLPANLVVIGNSASAEALAALGIPARVLRIGIPDAEKPDAWLALYREVLAASAA